MALHPDLEHVLRLAEDNALYRSHPDQVFRHATSALLLAKRLGEKEAEARGSHVLGMYSLDVGEYAKGLLYSQQSLRLFEAVDNREEQVHVLCRIGIAYSLQEDWVRSLRSFTEALHLAKELGKGHAVGLVHYYLAQVQQVRGEVQAAVQHNRLAIRHFDEAGERALTFATFNLATCYRDLNDHRTFEELLSTAKQLVVKDIERDIADRKVGASGFDLKLLADIQGLEGEFVKSYRSYEQAYHSLNAFGIPKTEAECLADLGRSALALHNYTEAEDYFRSSLKLAQTIGNSALLNQVQFEVATFFGKVGRTEEAKSTLVKVLAFARLTENIPLGVKALTALAGIHESAGSYRTASSMYKEAGELSQTLGSKPVPPSVLVSEDIRLLNSSGDRLAEAILLRSSEQVLRKENDRLKATVRELEAALVVARDRVGRVLKARTEHERLEQLRETLASITSVLSGQSQNEVLHRHLDGLNSEFVEKLRNQYPTLTATEVEVCSLVSLGFVNSEIQDILNLAGRTLENHRFRIRQKMGLSRSEKLENSLKSILEK